MNTKQIEYILELSKTKNFNRAAENMFISQPTMTYQINIAEEEIGFRIFDRSGRGATLTPAGEQFITTLRNIDAQLKKPLNKDKILLPNIAIISASDFLLGQYYITYQIL